MILWRGQVPAWECGADGRWAPRHVAGAFEEALAAAGPPSAACMAATVAMLAPAPRAGALVEVRQGAEGARLVMTSLTDGSAIAEMTVPGQAVLPVAAADVSGTRDMARAWEMDVMGHMNVQFYAGRVTSAEALLLGSQGCRSGTVVRPLEQRFRFSGELKAGEIVTSRAEVLDAARGSIRIDIAGATHVAASVECDLGAWGDAVIGELLRSPSGTTAPPEPVWSAGCWEPGKDTLARMTLLGRQEVAAWEVDHTGVMAPRFYFSRMAMGVPYLLGQMGLDRPYMLAHGLGRAAVGYRITYRRWPRAGDCIELRSGIGLVRDKSWRFRHAFVDVADGEVVSVSEAVIVLLDLATRRSTPLPPSIRDRALLLQI